MINRFYYTLTELIDVYETKGFKQLFIQWIGTYTDSSYTTHLFEDITDNYLDDIIAYIDIEAPVWENIKKPTVAEILANPDYKAQINKFMRKIRAWLEDSKYRYEKLIKLYTDNENSLMAKIVAESSVQFNDTPQTTTVGLDGDEYATTYTKNKSAVDGGTTMARLNEIRANWMSLYEEWTREFAKKFVI